MKKYLSKSPLETEQIAEKLSNELSAGDVIAFRGGLGMGKTCFVRGLAKGLGFAGYVTSPTFALVNEYIGGKFPLYHFDMYRINSWDELYSIGFFDYMDGDGIIVAEWSENIENALPDSTLFVEIKYVSEEVREITVFKKGEGQE